MGDCRCAGISDFYFFLQIKPFNSYIFSEDILGISIYSLQLWEASLTSYRSYICYIHHLLYSQESVIYKNNIKVEIGAA